ncbi:MAG: glycosyltransferase family A protein [Gemmataceae bacterium]
MPNPNPHSLLVISPVKDEAQYLERTIASVVAQKERPTLWVIVNDGSSDRTGEIADAAAAQYPWIVVRHLSSGRERRVGPGVIEAFYAGLEGINLSDYEYVCKLDGDLEFAPNYFADCFARFDADPRLGTFSGKCFVPVDGKMVLERSGDQFSHGVAKLYRRACFEEIGGFVREVMWDGIDCHRCRLFGWKALSDADPRFNLIHLRLMGSSHKSVYVGRRRWGRGQYFMGTHPLYILFVSLYRMAERPWILGGLNIFIGYMMAWMSGMRRYEADGFRQSLHRWQMAELRNYLPLNRLLARSRQKGTL